MSEIRIGVLLCDHIQQRFRGVAGDYEDMFRNLFSDQDNVSLSPFDLTAGVFPDDLKSCDAWLATGSSRSVYENEPWIRRFEDLVRRARAESRTFIGICFGHQMIGRALGGQVRRSLRGWGVGAKHVRIVNAQPWMIPPADCYQLLTVYGDQVEEPPPGATVLGSNEHCPISMMKVDDNFLGIQGHPELLPDYVRVLIKDRRGQIIPEDLVDSALETLNQPLDRALLARWIVAFVRSRVDY